MSRCAWKTLGKSEISPKSHFTLKRKLMVMIHANLPRTKSRVVVVECCPKGVLQETKMGESTPRAKMPKNSVSDVVHGRGLLIVGKWS